jgi:hypothetical protein
VATFAGEQRPGAPAPDAVERRAVVDRGPRFDVGIPVVREGEREIAPRLIKPARTLHQCRNAYRQGERVDAGILFPAILLARGAGADLETVMPVTDFHQRNPRARRLQDMLVQAFDLHPEPCIVGDDEPEITDLRNVDTRIIDLVHDAAPDREPDTAGAWRATHHLLGAAAPGRREPGRPGREGAAGAGLCCGYLSTRRPRAEVR